MKPLDAQYWEARYQAQDFPWDAGGPTTPLTRIIDGLEDRQMRILIPGGGMGHELAYLWDRGFHNSYMLDYAPQTPARVRQLYPQVPEAHIVVQDFFDHTGQYDLILEQTFFCALDPQLRSAYARHMLQLLAPGGWLMGVLFTFPLTEQGPPFGGSMAAYAQVFADFDSVAITPCDHSIKPRQGNECLIQLRKALD
jgi:thiopurine S-methyltransferase